MSKALTLKKALTMSDKDFAFTHPRSARYAPLPDASVCAGAQVVRSYLVVCHAYLERPCEFGLRFGEVCYCSHPRRLEIAARTRHLERAKRQPPPA